MKKRTQRESPGKKGNQRATRRQKAKVLDSLSGTDALSILRTLAERHPALAEEMDAIAEDLLGEVDVEGVAVDVKAALESLEPEDVWDRSGETRHGYVDPTEAAWELIEEVMEPFRDEIEKYRKLGLFTEANLYYRGLLKGLYDFDRESSTSFTDWAADSPAIYFGVVLDAWKALPKGRISLDKIRAFVQETCPDYSHFGVR